MYTHFFVVLNSFFIALYAQCMFLCSLLVSKVIFTQFHTMWMTSLCVLLFSIVSLNMPFSLYSSLLCWQSFICFDKPTAFLLCLSCPSIRQTFYVFFSLHSQTYYILISFSPLSVPFSPFRCYLSLAFDRVFFIDLFHVLLPFKLSHSFFAGKGRKC